MIAVFLKNYFEPEKKWLAPFFLLQPKLRAVVKVVKIGLCVDYYSKQQYSLGLMILLIRNSDRDEENKISLIYLVGDLSWKSSDRGLWKYCEAHLCVSRCCLCLGPSRDSDLEDHQMANSCAMGFLTTWQPGARGKEDRNISRNYEE